MPGLGLGLGLGISFGQGADVPQLIGAAISFSGTILNLTFDRVVSFGAGGNGGWVPTLSGGAATLTYSSGAGSSILAYTISRTVGSGETGTLAYTQPGNGVEDSSGNDLGSFTGVPITNNVGSTYRRPDGISRYKRSDGVFYINRP